MVAGSSPSVKGVSVDVTAEATAGGRAAAPGLELEGKNKGVVVSEIKHRQAAEMICLYNQIEPLMPGVVKKFLGESRVVKRCGRVEV